MKIIKQIMTIILTSGLLLCSIVEARTLKMGGNFYNPPYLYIEDGSNYTGFEVDLIIEIGKLKGFEVKFYPKAFPHIFDDLKNKEIDFIGNVYYSEKRKANYLLSEPDYYDKIKFLTLKDKNIIDPLNGGEFTVNTLGFSPIEEIFQEQVMRDYPNLKIKSELTTYMGLKNLFLKKVDLLLTTQLSINQLRKNHQKYESQFQVLDFPEKYPQTVAMSYLTTKDNPQLIAEINEGLKILKENGTYQKLLEKYGL